MSIVELLVYNRPFPFKQLYGMTALVACAILISLSEVINPEVEEGSQIAQKDDNRQPVWAAVLCSFCMPVVCSLFIIPIKHSSDTLGIASYDFTISYWGLVSLGF